MNNHSTTLDVYLDKTDISTLYKSKAGKYDFWGKLTESNALRRCVELAAIEDGESVLEVAVGTGLTFQRILERNPSGVNEGVDLTEAMLAKAKQKAAQSGTNNYRLRIGDAYALDFDDNSFDALINTYMFDLLPEADFPNVLTEFNRVLKPGGRLVLANMAQDGRWYNNIWNAVYRIQPKWIGGCRGVDLLTHVQHAGFRQITRESIVQMTFPSEVLRGIKA